MDVVRGRITGDAEVIELLPVCRQYAQNLILYASQNPVCAAKVSRVVLILERRMGCVFNDANCFEPCHWLLGRASSGIGTNSASLRRQPHSRRSPIPLEGPLFVMESLEERKWKK